MSKIFEMRKLISSKNFIYSFLLSFLGCLNNLQKLVRSNGSCCIKKKVTRESAKASSPTIVYNACKWGGQKKLWHCFHV